MGIFMGSGFNPPPMNLGDHNKSHATLGALLCLN